MSTPEVPDNKASLPPIKIPSASEKDPLATWIEGIDLGPEPAEITFPEPAVLPKRSDRLPQHESARRTTQRSSSSLPVSSFPNDADMDLDQPRTGWWVWLGLGVAMAFIAQGAAWWFFHGTDTFGGALLFAVAGLAGFIFPLFQRNSKEIWSSRLHPWHANALLLLDLLVLFLGLVLGFFLLPLIMGAVAYAETFAGIARFIDVRRASLANFEFSGTLGIIAVNIRVALVFFLIGLAFSYVGTLIVMVWNASTWGVVFAAAISGGLAAGPASWKDGLRLAVVVLPHLIIETAAYLCAAMAGIFLSRALIRYRIFSGRFEMVGRSVLILVGVSLGLVVVAGLCEGIWGRWLARMWFARMEVMD